MIERIKRGLKNPRPYLMRVIRKCVKIIPEPLYLKSLFYLSQGYRRPRGIKHCVPLA